MKKVESPKVTIGKFRMSPTSEGQITTSQKFRTFLFNIITCGGLFWPQRFANAKIEQEEALAVIMNVEAEARLLEARSAHNESIANIELKMAECEKLRAETASQNLKNDMLQNLLGLEDRSAEDIVDSINSIVSQINLAGGSVEISNPDETSS